MDWRGFAYGNGICRSLVGSVNRNCGRDGRANHRMMIESNSWMEMKSPFGFFGQHWAITWQYKVKIRANDAELCADSMLRSGTLFSIFLSNFISSATKVAFTLQ